MFSKDASLLITVTTLKEKVFLLNISGVNEDSINFIQNTNTEEKNLFLLKTIKNYFISYNSYV